MGYPPSRSLRRDGHLWRGLATPAEEVDIDGRVSEVSLLPLVHENDGHESANSGEHVLIFSKRYSGTGARSGIPLK